MDAAIITSLARHILTAVGGGLAVRYGVDGATSDAIIGGLAALVGVAWSVWDKRAKS